MLLGRAHLARQCASGGESELGGASEDAQSYWQGRFAACALVDFFFGVEALPLDSARGNAP